MTHLHLPDGVLPWWLWVPGLVLAGLVLLWVSRRHRNDRRDRLALLGSLGGLMLAAMALPLGPLGYHLSLAPVVGIILGGGLAFVAAFVVNAILALLGHGGFTVVGLNALVTGTAAAVSGWTYRSLVERSTPFWRAAIASALGMLASLAVFLVVIALAGVTPNPAHDSRGERAAHSELEHRSSEPATGAEAPIRRANGRDQAWGRFVRFAVPSIPLWIVGTLAEALVASGVVSFLARVNPSLLGGSLPALAERSG